jgi:rhodanese-related sulfurtransferase
MKHRILRAFALACGLVGAMPAWPAGVVPGDQLPEDLRGVSPVQACRRDDDATPSRRNTTAAVAGPKAIEPDLSCAAGAEELALPPRDGNLPFWIDVRHAREFDISHIAGAMNLSLSELATKDFLQERRLVLVGNGRGERELYIACRSLKAAGFRDLRVLRGGLPMWLLRGQAAIGATEPPEPAKLSSEEFWVETRFEANLVLLAPEQAALREQLPLSMPLSQASAKAIKALIEKRRKELKKAPLAAVVLAVAPATPIAELRQLRLDLAPVPLLVYAQPAAVFVREMRQQQANWAVHARGPKQPPCR